MSGSGEAWRLVRLDSPGPRPGAEQMAVDQALLESVGAGGRPALRFYTWDPPCLSFGRNQPAAGLYDPDLARARGIDLVRRPTGGRAVYHDRELTYAVAVPVGLLGSPRQTYEAINRALVRGLRRVGAAAVVVGTGAEAAPPDSPAHEAPWRAPAAAGPLGFMPCFDAAMPGEVAVAGRKLVGSAQRREGRALLQHGSILLAGTQAPVVDLLRVAAPALPPAPPPATLAEVLGEPPAADALELALIEGWQEATGICLAPTPISAGERPRVRALVGQFGSAAWTWRR